MLNFNLIFFDVVALTIKYLAILVDFLMHVVKIITVKKMSNSFFLIRVHQSVFRLRNLHYRSNIQSAPKMFRNIVFLFHIII